MVSSAWAILGLALAGSPRSPAPASPGASVVFLAWSGVAVPVACVKGKDKVFAGSKCAMPTGQQRLHAPSGDLVSYGWDKNLGICPWDNGEREPGAGALRRCEDDSCFLNEMPPELAIWPVRSGLQFADTLARPASDPDVASRLDVIASEMKTRPEALIVNFARIVRNAWLIDACVRDPKRPPEVQMSCRTFVFWGSGKPRTLATPQCGGGEGVFVGAIDLDGDESAFVILYQYQPVVFRGDGSILVEGAPCCGAG
jgi:hypothetical protein